MLLGASSMPDSRQSNWITKSQHRDILEQFSRGRKQHAILSINFSVQFYEELCAILRRIILESHKRELMMLEICHRTFHLGLSEMGVPRDRRLCWAELSCLRAGGHAKDIQSGEGAGSWQSSHRGLRGCPSLCPWQDCVATTHRLSSLPAFAHEVARLGKLLSMQDCVLFEPNELNKCSPRKRTVAPWLREHLNSRDQEKAVQNEDIHDATGRQPWGGLAGFLPLEPPPEWGSREGTRMCSQLVLLLHPFLPQRGLTSHP